MSVQTEGKTIMVKRRRGLPDLLGLAEIGALRDAQASALSMWRARFDDFPEPAYEFAIGDVFLADEVHAFLERHPNLGGRRGIDPVIREAIRDEVTAGCENMSELAERMGVSRATVYNVAGDLIRARRGE